MKHFFIFLCSLMLANNFSYCQPGTPDSTFNDSGKVLGFQFGDCTGLAIQKDGKILIGGGHNVPEAGIYIARYLKDCSPDPSFGQNGFAYSPQMPYLLYSSVQPIQIQPDGKIVTAAVGNTGLYHDDIVLIRYLENGHLDSGFGENGLSNIDFGYDEYIADIALQEDGKIVVEGTAFDDLGSLAPGFLTARFNNDGTVDSSFGNGGKIVETTGDIPNGQGAPSVCMEANGKILTGIPINVNHNSYFLVVRYMPDGKRDSSFGENGAARADFVTHNNDDQLYNIALQEDGKILAVGITNYEARTPAKIGLARFNTDGSLDEGFGNGGLVSTQVGNKESLGYDVTVQPNNKIVVTGRVLLGSRDDMLLLRYLPNGLLDSGFAENGCTILDFNNFYDRGTAVAVQKDGNILVGGTSEYNGTSYFISRYLGDPVNQPPLISKIKRWIRNHILNFQDANPNADYYVIEQSNNLNTDFKEVSRLKAESPKLKASSSTPGNIYGYSIPNNQQQAVTYYRIKAVNKDNSFTYSSVINSSIDAAVINLFSPSPLPARMTRSDREKTGVRLYPNPAKDKINIESAVAVNLCLQNSYGQMLLEQKVKGTGSIDISKVPVGIYYIIDTETGQSWKLMKE